MRKQGNCNQNFNSCLCLVALSACVCFWHKKAFWHVFCFYVYAQYTNRKPCVSKAIAIKISTYCNQNFNSCICLVLCLPAFVFLHKNVFCKLFFLFGCHAVVVNCAFARYCQIFVAFVTSARYCVGILRFSQCIFVVLQHNKSDFRYLLLSSTFQRQKIAFVVFFAFEITCALKKRFAYCLVLGRIFPQAKAVSAMCCTF